MKIALCKRIYVLRLTEVAHGKMDWRTEVADGKMERKGAETALMEISPIILGFKVVLEFLKLRFCTLLLRMSCLRCNVHFEVRSH
ncbi:unnamed protein product [Urochloa humidicola]